MGFENIDWQRMGCLSGFENIDWQRIGYLFGFENIDWQRMGCLFSDSGSLEFYRLSNTKRYRLESPNTIYKNSLVGARATTAIGSPLQAPKLTPQL